jgi:polysaccharide export outer membrane protein
MTGSNRLKLALTAWTVAALGLGTAGCQQLFPFAQTETSAQATDANERPVDRASSEVVQVGYQPSYSPTYGSSKETHAKCQPDAEAALTPAPVGNGRGHPNAMLPSDMPPNGSNGHPGVLAEKPPAPLPRELGKTVQPSYIIEPPDTLMIDAIRLIPRPPYRIEPLDALIIQVVPTLPDQPIAGAFAVTPDGYVNLGYTYGTVRVAGLTLEQAIANIKSHLAKRIVNPEVAVALASMRAIQQVRGEHLVNQDGTVTLGSYGCVNVTGLTLWQAKLVMERYLSRWFLNPDISITVNGFNSKVYYVIFDGGGYGQQIVPLPITGNETVLDAIAKVGGLPPVSSRRKIWVARPSPKDCYQLLPVDWEAITKGGDPSTNWQLFPGDRVYVAADPLIGIDNALAKILAPIERLLGVTLLGSSTVQSIRNNNHSFFGF